MPNDPSVEPRQTIRLRPEEKPILVVSIATEEEFEWARGFDPSARGVRAVADLAIGHELFEDFAIKPVYLLTHPVATDNSAQAVLHEIAGGGNAEIGAHVHPWVTPPIEEPITSANSYPGNLPRTLEERKIRGLTEAIEKAFGDRPTCYLAGRYGFGPNTAETLATLGFETDMSSSPGFDFSADGGPDHSRASASPAWFGPEQRLLEVPTTGGFIGWLRAPALYAFATRSLTRRLRVPGILARARAVERLRLSPEGFEFGDLVRLTRTLHSDGERIFNFSVHSPSFGIGYTPYVQSQADLHKLLDTCRRYFEFFRTELGGVSMTARELYRHLEAQRLEPNRSEPAR